MHQIRATAVLLLFVFLCVNFAGLSAPPYPFDCFEFLIHLCIIDVQRLALLPSKAPQPSTRVCLSIDRVDRLLFKVSREVAARARGNFFLPCYFAVNGGGQRHAPRCRWSIRVRLAYDYGVYFLCPASLQECRLQGNGPSVSATRTIVSKYVSGPI